MLELYIVFNMVSKWCHMKRITLRLPDDLHNQIEALAIEENRSLNAEIVRAIKTHLLARARLAEADKDFTDMRAGLYVELEEITEDEKG